MQTTTECQRIMSIAPKTTDNLTYYELITNTLTLPGMNDAGTFWLHDQPVRRAQSTNLPPGYSAGREIRALG